MDGVAEGVVVVGVVGVVVVVVVGDTNTCCKQAAKHNFMDSMMT